MRWGPRSRKNLSESRGGELVWESTADTPSDSGSATAVGGIAIITTSSVSTGVWGRSDLVRMLLGMDSSAPGNWEFLSQIRSILSTRTISPLKYLHSWLPYLFTRIVYWNTSLLSRDTWGQFVILATGIEWRSLPLSPAVGIPLFQWP